MMKKTDTQVILPIAPSVEDTLQQAKDFHRIKSGLIKMMPNSTCQIQGKPFLKKEGWRWIALHFQLSDEIISHTTDKHKDVIVERIVVKTSSPNGRFTTGVGICSSKERNFAHPEHDIFATAHTRAKNRAISDMVGGGEVSAEEMQ